MENQKDTALLVMDVQSATVAMLQQHAEAYLKTMSEAIKKARAKNIPVIYVVIGFRPGFPEISPNSPMFARIKSNPAMKFDAAEAMKVHPSVAPIDGDVTVIKKRVSAFAGSDLEIVLRSMGIKHIVLSGIAVCLLTKVELADKKKMDITVSSLQS